MYHRIMEILVLLMDEIGHEDLKIDEIDQLSEDLIERGYTEQEINTAFYWLHQRFTWEEKSDPGRLELELPAESSHRVLHPLEQRYLDAEAHGYLLQLRHLNIISAKEMEEIINRLFILDFRPTTIDDVRALVQSLLFEESDFGTRTMRSLGHMEKGESYH